MQNVSRYQQLAGGSEQLESQLPDSLDEYINAEIVLRTIKDTPTALAWLRSTFLSIRVMQRGLETPCKPCSTGLWGPACLLVM